MLSLSNVIQWLTRLFQDDIIGDLKNGITTRSFMINQVGNVVFISKLKSKYSDEILWYEY